MAIYKTYLVWTASLLNYKTVLELISVYLFNFPSAAKTKKREEKVTEFACSMQIDLNATGTLDQTQTGYKGKVDKNTKRRIQF